MSLTGGAAGYVRGEVVELGNGRAILMTEGLPAPSEGEVYEAWLLRDGVPEPAGLFESHHGTVAMPIESSIEDADAVAVTVGPSGGSLLSANERTPPDRHSLVSASPAFTALMRGVKSLIGELGKGALCL